MTAADVVIGAGALLALGLWWQAGRALARGAGLRAFDARDGW